MQVRRLTTGEFWGSFQHNYRLLGRPARQAEAIEKHLGVLPQADATLDMGKENPVFRDLGVPWIPELCEENNFGAMKFLGGDYAPEPQLLARFLSRLLLPSLKRIPIGYLPVLADGIRSGFLCLRETTSGRKSFFSSFMELRATLSAAGLQVKPIRKADLPDPAYKGESFRLIDPNQFQADMFFRTFETAMEIIVYAPADNFHFTGRLVRALGPWDIKFSSGLDAVHLWQQGLESSEATKLMLAQKELLNPVGIGASMAATISDKSRQTVLQTIGTNVVSLAQQSADQRIKILMFLNLGKLKWVEIESLSAYLFSTA